MAALRAARGCKKRHFSRIAEVWIILNLEQELLFCKVLLLALFDHLLYRLGLMRAHDVSQKLVAAKHWVFELAFVDNLELARIKARIIFVLVVAH